jgi:hypothetical protein
LSGSREKLLNQNMMEKRAKLPEQRRQRIVMRLREAGSVTVAGLEKELGISAATARRDLVVLERQGEVKRTHGGAVPPGLAQHEDSFQQRLGEAVEAKQRLARAAAGLLGADQSVFIDSSTTAYYAARRILAGHPGAAHGPLLDGGSFGGQHGGTRWELQGAHPLVRRAVHDTGHRVLRGGQGIHERQGAHTRRAAHRHQPARSGGQEGHDPSVREARFARRWQEAEWTPFNRPSRS